MTIQNNDYARLFNSLQKAETKSALNYKEILTELKASNFSQTALLKAAQQLNQQISVAETLGTFPTAASAASSSAKSTMS